jgi:hypothetical protein
VSLQEHHYLISTAPDLVRNIRISCRSCCNFTAEKSRFGLDEVEKNAYRISAGKRPGAPAFHRPYKWKDNINMDNVDCLFNGCVNYFIYVASNCGMFYGWLIGYYLNESGSGLFYIINAFYWRDLGKLSKTLVRVVSLQIETESRNASH